MWILHILYPESSYSDAWRDAAYPPLVVGGVSLALVVLIAVVIAARLGRPLTLLRRQVEQIAAGRFEPLPLPLRDDEVRDLAVAVNRMTEMLAGFEQKIRRTEQLRTLGQISGGIAHQLRNSVTGCRMALDLHRRECPLNDHGDTLEVAVRQLVLMESFIHRLVNRARSDPASYTPVDLADVLERTLPLLKPVAAHVHVDLAASLGDDNMVVLGDDDELEQLVTNLVINAIDAAARTDEPTPPAGRKVEMALRCVGAEQIAIDVRDSGRGVDSAISERVFEPLVTSKPDGTGLGLWIASDVAKRHGGTIAWVHRDGYTCFTVELPRYVTEESCVQTVGR